MFNILCFPKKLIYNTDTSVDMVYKTYPRPLHSLVPALPAIAMFILLFVGCLDSVEVTTSGLYNLLLYEYTRVNHFVFSLEMMTAGITVLVDRFNAS